MVLLSVQQKYILETLRKLGCVRKDQLHALVRGKFQRPGFDISETRMAAMLPGASPIPPGWRLSTSCWS